MPLSGYSLPLSPKGTASLVPPPPWHFSGDALVIDYVADRAAIAAVLPDAFEPIGDGKASFTFVDWSSAADADERLVRDPARGQYREAYVTVYATLDGTKVARVPYIWVDNDLSLVRGLIQGFPKKLGTVEISRAVRVGRGGPRLEPGGFFSAHVSSLGNRLAIGNVRLVEKVDGFIPRSLRVPVWHSRLLPDLAGGEPLVDDLARNIVTGFDVADVWRGEAALEIAGSQFEEVGGLAPIEILEGYRCSAAFTITGAETRQG